MQSLFYFMSAYFFAVCGKITKTKKGGEILRRSGILLPVFSLPGNYGTGTLGKSAYDFVDFLSASGQSIWQTLPLTPTSYGNSPYQSPSVFAGNPYFIDLDLLVKDDLLTQAEIDAATKALNDAMAALKKVGGAADTGDNSRLWLWVSMPHLPAKLP